MPYKFISSTTLAGTANKVQFTGIPAGYKNLQIYYSVGTTTSILATFNDNTPSTIRYQWTQGYARGVTETQASNSNATSMQIQHGQELRHGWIVVPNYNDSNNPAALIARSGGSLIWSHSYGRTGASSTATSDRVFGVNSVELSGTFIAGDTFDFYAY